MGFGSGKIWIILILFVAAILLLPVLLMGSPMWIIPGQMMGSGMMRYRAIGFGGGFIILFLRAVLVGLVVLGLYYLLTGHYGPHKESTSEALEILKQRYARGEITEDQFKKMKENLED
jgi:putative membrane protein